MFTCDKCWDNPCTCGAQMRRGLALVIEEGVDTSWKVGDPPTRLKPGGSLMGDDEYRAHWGDAAFAHLQRHEKKAQED